MQTPSQAIGEVFFAFCKTLDTPVSLRCWLQYKYDEHLALATTGIDPAHYNDSASFSKDYAAVSFLSKFPGLRTGVDLEKVAFDSFRKAEAECSATNLRFRAERSGHCVPRYAGILHAARRKISRVLGPLVYNRVFDHCKWGPGATLDLRRSRSQPDNKYSVIPITVSPGALGIAKAMVESDPNWLEAILGQKPDGLVSVRPEIFSLVDHNRLQFVPKNAKTHRSIAVEPRLNGYLQQGVGRYIRRRLMAHGVDLSDQSINQKLASRAAAEGLATVDFSAASDSISRELVFELLPLDWFLLLDSIRSKSGVYTTREGETWNFSYEKFSSMGNAFTFELESLIFWALAVSVCDSLNIPTCSVSVFGDDVIIPKDSYELFASVSSHCGFTVNSAKSFSTGLFYESCGKHYFDGHDVTPLYQKEDLMTFESLVRAHNRVFRWARRVGTAQDPALSCLRRIARDRYSDADDYLLSHDGFGDCGWLVPLSSNPLSRFDVDRGCWVYPAFRESAPTRYGKGSAMLAGWLRTNRHGELPSDSSACFGGLVAASSRRVTLVGFYLDVYSWNDTLID